MRDRDINFDKGQKYFNFLKLLTKLFFY